MFPKPPTVEQINANVRLHRPLRPNEHALVLAIASTTWLGLQKLPLSQQIERTRSAIFWALHRLYWSSDDAQTIAHILVGDDATDQPEGT